MDFDEEARKLFKVLNLPETGAASHESESSSRYRNMDPVWRHPTTGAQVFIGNQSASADLDLLSSHGVSRIVNTTDSLPCFFDDGGPIQYFRFDIYSHYRTMSSKQSGGEVLGFFSEVFAWIDECVANGESVLIHCLAGAHRAGTTGVAYTMHATGLDHQTAIAACKQCRPVVNPIGDLTRLLATLEEGMRTA
eukprot:TRINITY_DN29826_c0_g1_i1.p1 TRINITY_DN29826_c0_g1~~TRINITY_DN29826_c0_g1_i1.p1  ORF type:complete len:193 (+),score=18.04 TRINITY_DN29826_c0_g1_i1:179-757(+)